VCESVSQSVSQCVCVREREAPVGWRVQRPVEVFLQHFLGVRVRVSVRGRAVKALLHHLLCSAYRDSRCRVLGVGVQSVPQDDRPVGVSASERRGNKLKGSGDVFLRAKARRWS
jgi:hypothetical protein